MLVAKTVAEVDTTYEMPASRLVVLHFDSCTFEQWRRKFERLAQRATRASEIPFDFYKQSIAKIQSGASDDELRAFYEANKWTAC